MFNFIKKLYFQVVDLGVTLEMETQLQRRIRLTNQLAFFLVYMDVPVGAISYYVGDFVALKFDILVATLCLFALLFNKAGMTYFARHTVITGVGIVGGLNHLMLGPLVAINHGYFVWLLLPFVMFEIKDRIHIFLCTTMISVLFLITEFYRFPSLMGFEAPVERALIIKFVMSLLFLFVICFMAYQLVKENYLSELKLKEEMKNIHSLNEQLVEQQKALVRASRMAALGEMASAMSHEINNPLAVIKMSSQYLDKLEERNQLTEEFKNKTVRKIDEAVMRISGIISGLRRFSGIETASPDSTDIYEALENTLSLCRERFQERGMLLKLQDIRHFRVHMNTYDLHHVLYNVLTNALEHSQHENTDEKWVSITLQDQGDSQVLLIENGGQPISQEISERIFEPFFTTKNIGQGMGMGLASSQGLMSAQGGNLKLDTTSGRTCFILEFPLLKK